MFNKIFFNYDVLSEITIITKFQILYINKFYHPFIAIYLKNFFQLQKHFFEREFSNLSTLLIFY